MFHLVTFYGKPPFVLNSFQIFVIPSTEFEAFPHHSMMTLRIHFHRTQRNQSLLETMQRHLNKLLALRYCPDNYSVMKYFIKTKITVMNCPKYLIFYRLAHFRILRMDLLTIWTYRITISLQYL